MWVNKPPSAMMLPPSAFSSAPVANLTMAPFWMISVTPAGTDNGPMTWTISPDFHVVLVDTLSE